MGFFSSISNVFDPLQLMGGKQKIATSEYQDKMDEAKAALGPAYKTAADQLRIGTDTATGTAKSGFQKARADTSAGYGAAGQQLRTGGQQAIDTAKSGYASAQKRFDSPEMVASRSEIYNRILGKGGLSPEIVNQQAAAAREEYGAGLRGATEAANAFQGEAAAPGLAQENIARAATTLGTNRANAVRDINMRNAELARQEQTGAMASAQSEALQRAGLDAQEAQVVSGLQEKLAEGGANLTAQETNALAQLAAQEGITVADLQQKLAAGTANLTAEEAKALAEMTTAGATAGLQIGSQKGMLGGIF